MSSGRSAADLANALAKATGRYYTPSSASRIIAEWAIRDSEDVILEPSVGTGSFVDAAIDRLLALGARDPAKQIYAVDLDRRVFEEGTVAALPSGHARHIDFLRLEPHHVPEVDVVVGNPPWVRAHLLHGQALKAARNQVEVLPGTSAYWAYFVVHAGRFVRNGGRMALMLPAAVLRAKYATVVRDHVEAEFGHVAYLSVREPIFAGIHEPFVVMLAMDKGGPKLAAEKFRSTALVDVGSLKSSRPDVSLWTAANRSPRLDSRASVRIGIVTGDNAFFLHDRAGAERLTGGRFPAVTCLSRRRHLSPVLGQNEIDHLVDDGERIFLPLPSTGRETRALRALIKAGEASGVHLRLKCRIREPWWSVHLGEVPDILVSPLGSLGLELAVNEARAYVTNGLYGLYMKSDRGKPLDLALSLRSSIVEWQAEEVGHALGGGALKLDPRHLMELRVPDLKLNASVSARIVRRLVAGEASEVRAEVDAQIVAAGIMSPHEVSAATVALEQLRSERMTQSTPPSKA